MRRRKNTVRSSFDLFLDTVCNTFGGVLFIAIMVVIQVRHVTERPIPETCSPERMAELLQQVEKLVTEIDSATILLDTIRKTLPEPVGENDKRIIALYSERLEKKNDLIVQKAERTREFIAQTKENAELERRINELAEKLNKAQAVESQLLQTVQNLRDTQRTLEQKTADLQTLVRRLEAEVTQKARRVQDKHDLDKNTRQEELLLPKMQDAGRLTPFYLVLRFNRLYVVAHRGDFDYRGNLLGVPKKNRGFWIDDTDAVKRQIRNTFQSASPSTQFIGIFVYGDSVDSFYVVRDTIIDAGFRYELIPSPDDTPWSFGSGGGSTQIQ